MVREPLEACLNRPKWNIFELNNFFYCLLRLKIYLSSFYGWWVSFEPPEWGNSITVEIFALCCPWPGKTSKNISKICYSGCQGSIKCKPSETQVWTALACSGNWILIILLSWSLKIGPLVQKLWELKDLGVLNQNFSLSKNKQLLNRWRDFQA